MMKLLEKIMGLKRVTLAETERALVLRKGRIEMIFGPGEQVIKNRDVLERHDLTDGRFISHLSEALFRARPDLAEAHLTEVRTGPETVAVVEKDGRLYTVVAPDRREVYWTDAGPWTVTEVDLTEGLAVDKRLGERLARAKMTTLVATTEVPEGHVGMLTVDGAHEAMLPKGTHRFWAAGRTLKVKLIDLRWRVHELTGHEVLTKDRVTLRINMVADYRVTDPERAVGEVKDFEEALRLSLALAFRKSLGALTLDGLLADKVAVDAAAADAVRAEMAKIGLEVGAISLKDVVLPGEMRDILTAVVAAEKEAEANVIRRREETNATRSLLNTAKVMADNPVMLRLKELEALEAIAGKVERLTVHNGTEGLMTDLVKLRD